MGGVGQAYVYWGLVFLRGMSLACIILCAAAGLFFWLEIFRGSGKGVRWHYEMALSKYLRLELAMLGYGVFGSDMFFAGMALSWRYF